MATGSSRPTVALVAMTLPGVSSPLAELVTPNRERFRFVGVASSVPPPDRHLLEWHRIPRVPGPLRLRWANFFIRASLCLRRQQVDLIHVLGPSPLVAQRVDLATITFHWAGYDRTLRAHGDADSSLVEAIGRRVMLGVERSCYRPGRVRMLATLSEPARQEVASMVPGVPVGLTTAGVDSQRFRPDPGVRQAVRTAAGVQPEEVVAVFVGSERRDTKGLRLAISAFAQALRAGKGPTRLWVVGTAGPRWQRLVAGLGLEHHIDLLGFRPDVERFMAAADVFVLPTVYEVSCRAAHEAAASGLPLVAPGVHAVAELVGHDEAGVIVARDIDSIANALSLLAGDDDLRGRLGAEARRRALAIGDGGYPQAVVSLYEQLLARPAASPGESLS
jgi:glycosyltransferase involved in cell wall biosynthesis